jgi:hypothetical protein
MPIIKETIKYVGDTMNIRFGLSSEDGFLGLQQEIDNLTEVVSSDLVNPSIDVEERKFKYLPGISPTVLAFQFYSPIANDYLSTFLYQGFTGDEIISNSSNLENSFFIMDFYDSFDVGTQVKIFSTYLTKVIGNNPDGSRNYTSIYTIGGTIPNQLYYWYVPISYLTAISGSTITGYTKFGFYNAKSGTTVQFYNFDNQSLSTPEKMYFKSTLNVPNRTWNIISASAPNLVARQLWTSPAYNQKVNNTVQNFNNEVQDYPTGQTFNYIDGKYF